MANQEHLDILAKGVGPWNAWRGQTAGVPSLEFAALRGAHMDYIRLSSARLTSAELAGASLRHADLTGAQLLGADLTGAHLAEADLSGADLNGADLSGADLSNAALIRASFRGAVLNRANLCGTHLHGADIRGAHLNETDFASASLGNTYFANVDLSTAKGLDTTRSAAPSSIGLDTIYRSHGRIPEAFLRGAGVPENFITFMRSLTGVALEFYSCFISYSTKDQDFADRLYADLQARGVRCWFAPHDIQGGQKIHEQIDEAIRGYDKLLLILSDASMNSNWVKTEIANARDREEQQKRQMLFPITIVPLPHIKDWKLFDADRGIDSAREIREYFIPDFSNWKEHDLYQKEFDRLLRDLRSDAARDQAGA